MSRPSDDMTLEELREEYDWIYEFQSRMAERISGNPDVHNHADYVNRLQAENAELQAENAHLWELVQNAEYEESVAWDMVRSAERRNDRLRKLVLDMRTCIQTADKSDNAWDECPRCSLWNGNNNHRCEFDRRMKELGVEE